MKRTTFLAHTAAAALSFSPLARALAATTVSRAVFSQDAQSFSLGNDAIAAAWTLVDGKLRASRYLDRVNGAMIPAPSELFTVTLNDGTAYAASAFAITTGPAEQILVPNAAAPRYGERVGGTQVSVVLTHASAGLRATWRAVIRDGSRYLRQELTLEALGKALALSGVKFIDLSGLNDAFVAGDVDGSPIISGNTFFALEHPFAQTDAFLGSASATLPQRVPLRPGVPLTVSSVVGICRPNQLRRDFLDYIERERAHPYRTFLHYNSWYDLGAFGRYTADQAVERINAFGKALHVDRGVKLESFLFDDGWDDPDNLWHLNAGFPDGIAPLTTAAAVYGAAPGIWLSPWGGYGDPRTHRLASAKRLGYEINSEGLALSGPKYYEYFSDVVANFLRSGVNQFKLDGTGDAGTVYPGSAFGSDFDAAIALIGSMRALKPDVYVNLTTGTYPSPFWLRYCDSIWRGGYDHNFEGVGTQRQRWITYRDADTYAGIVVKGPLYPLNSLMLHGLIYAQYADALSNDPNGDFRDEVRSYFGTGTQLQEMYITPTLLSSKNWDDIAASAKWSAANADVLRDTHWVGGDPGRLDVYGWAAWSPRKGTLTLRNPSDRQKSIAIDVGDALELPAQADHRYRIHERYERVGAHPVVLQSGSPHLLTLQPFEVLSLDLYPVRG